MLSAQMSMTLLPDGIEAGRTHTAGFTEDLTGFDVIRRDLIIPGYQTAGIELTVFTPRTATAARRACSTSMVAAWSWVTG